MVVRTCNLGFRVLRVGPIRAQSSFATAKIILPSFLVRTTTPHHHILKFVSVHLSARKAHLRARRFVFDINKLVHHLTLLL